METRRITDGNAGRYWFKAKTNGWGWVPISREGRLIAIGYAVLLLGWLIYLAVVDEVPLGFDPDLAAIVPVAVLTLLLVAVCWLKSDRRNG